MAASLLVGSRGAWGAVAIPAACFGFGLVLFLVAGEPSPPSGGDADPARLIGGVLLVVSAPWTVLTCVVVAVVRGRRRSPSGRSASSLRRS